MRGVPLVNLVVASVIVAVVLTLIVITMLVMTFTMAVLSAIALGHRRRAGYHQEAER